MLACLLFYTLILVAQEEGNLSVNFTFDNTTEVKEIKVPIAPDLKQVKFHFSGKIKSGSLKVRILDPNGKKTGGFQLESHTRDSSGKQEKDPDPENNTFAYSIVGDSNSTASGSMNKEVSKPIPGLWKIEITVAKATGMLVSGIQQNND